MNKTCIIIDDEKLALDLLTEYLDDFDQVEIVAKCKSGMEAIQKIEEEKPDIIFLDVHMPSVNGFEVLEAISYKPKIVFTTAYDKYAVKAFEKNAVDYLLKPIDKTRFNESINRILAPTSKSPDIEKLLEEISNQASIKYSETIFVQKSDKYFRINAKDIVYLEASGDYTVISTDKKQYLSSKGISRLESKLDPDLFLRIHRSTIINHNQLSE